MKFFLLSVLFLSIYLSSFAQERQYSTTNQSAIKNYALSSQSLDENLFDDAVEQLLKAIDEDHKFIEAHARLADIYRRQWRYKDAIDQYNAVLKLNPDFNEFVYFKLADCEIHIAAYADSKQHLEKYLSFISRLSPQNVFMAQKLVKDCEFSIGALQRPVPFKPLNLGVEINTANDEYFPAITADEKTLIFTRKINNNEDFYKSTRVDGKWQTATALSTNINSTYNEGALSLSQDGKVLFFTGCNRPDGLGRCDIYISQKRGNDWSTPFDISPPVNTPGWESQPSISSDGRTLYFVSNRKGGYGGYDIWKSNLTDKGWSEPENLGPNVNTMFDEQSPFIHPDDSTLYFCSNGWPGMGGKDLFVSRLGKDGKWQKPENLGYPINSNGDENGLTLTANGNYAFFSSNTLSGAGGFDIYTFELPEHLRPHRVTYVKGRVLDAKTKQPLEAAVEIVDLEKENPVYQDYSSEDHGDFLATITTGKNYGLNISKDGYLFYSANFSLIGHEDKNPYNIEVLLQPIEVGNKVILENIFFDTNKWMIKDPSKPELKKLIDFLSQNTGVRIEISGHTDNVGTHQSNQVLSENRAKAVYQYLIVNGINDTRLVFKGYGETQPIAPNDNDEGRSKNRRTEFKIISK